MNTSAANDRRDMSDAHESREVAEGARQDRWEKRSFMKELFGGRLSLDLVHPHPEQDPEEAARAAPFLESIRRFAEEHVDGDAFDRDGWVPDSVLQGLAELGAFGVKIPREYGGLGLSQTSYNRALALVASRCASTAAFLSAHQSIGVPTPLVLFGTEEQKRKYLPRLAGGELSAFALTEPDVGSDPANMSTFAELSADGTHYILNGEKLWTTNGPRSDLLVVMARTAPREGVRGKRPISAFIVETGWPGVEVGQICRFMGLHGISNGVLHFHNVKVPRENLLWGEGLGLKLALITLNTGRLALPAFCAAAGKGLLRACRKWAGERVQWGAPIGKHDAVAQMLGRMAAETYAMEAAVELAAAMSGLGTLDIRLEAAAAKLWHSEKAWDLVNDAVQIRGGRGYETADSLRQRGEDPFPVERALRDSRINLIFEGVERDHAALHCAGGGGRTPDRGRCGHRSAAAAVDAFGCLPQGRDPLRALVSRQVAGMGAVAALRLLRPPGHPCALREPGVAEARPHPLPRHRALRTQTRATAGGLGRLVDIGGDLFVVTASCVRAMKLVRDDPADRTPFELADAACKLARRRIRANFRAVFRNDDTDMYKVARGAMGDRYEWLEQGIADALATPRTAAPAAAPRTEPEPRQVAEPVPG